MDSCIVFIVTRKSGIGHLNKASSKVSGNRPESWGVLPHKLGNWVGVCGSLSQALTLFMTKICDFPYPIDDLFMT